MKFLLEIRQLLLTFSSSGERRDRNEGAATGFMLNKDAWKEKIIYFGLTFLNKLGIVCAKLHIIITWNILALSEICPREFHPFHVVDETQHALLDLNFFGMYCTQLRTISATSTFSEQPFTWLTQALTPCQSQGRVVGSQKVQGSISALLSWGGHRPPSPGYPDTSFLDTKQWH